MSGESPLIRENPPETGTAGNGPAPKERAPFSTASRKWPMLVYGLTGPKFPNSPSRHAASKVFGGHKRHQRLDGQSGAGSKMARSAPGRSRHQHPDAGR